MKKATLIAAVAALALSGGAYAQAGGGTANGGSGSSHGGTPNPAATQMNNSTGGYGMPGSANSDSGMNGGQTNSMQKGSNDPANSPAPKTNNTLATPSVTSPAGK